MPFNIKGITVEIDGDATKLTDALKKVEREYSNLDKNARDLKNAIRLSGKDTGLETYRTALKLTEEQTERTAAKTDLLKQAIDHHSETVEKWKARLVQVQSEMKNLDTQIQAGKQALKMLTDQHRLTSQQLDKAKESYQNTCRELDDFRNALKKAETEESKLQTALKKEKDNHEKLQNALRKSQDAELNLERQASNLNQQMLLQQQVVNENRQRFEEGKRALERYLASGEATEEGIKQLTDSVYKLEVRWKQSELALSKQSAQLDKVNDKIRESRSAQDKYKEAISESESKLEGYKEELRQIAEKKEELKQRITELTEQQKRQKEVMDQTQAAYDTEEQDLKDLTDEVKKLETAYSKLSTEEKTLKANLENEEKTLLTLQAQYQKNIETLKQYKEEMLKLAKAGETGGMYGAGQRMSESLQNAGKTLEGIGRNTRLLSVAAGTGLGYAVKSAANVESAFVGVQKTVDATDEQFAKINQGLWDLARSTGTAYEDIAKYGELGGQLGIAADDIVDFTRVVTQLGDTTNIVGEEGASAMAKFANLMHDEFQRVQANTGDWYNRYGSTIVDLGNNFATTEADIQAMSTRLAAAGTQAGMSTPNILALATTLSSMGLRTDEAGSSISKFIQKIQLAVETGTDDLPHFAEISGKTSEQFVKDWKTDASSALLDFIEGLSKCDEGSTTLQKLAEAGLNSEIRMTRALGGLANGHELYARAIDTATRAWENNSAMQAEADKRYATTERAVGRAKEAIKEAASAMGDTMRPAVEKVCDSISKACDWFLKLDDGGKKTATAIGVAAAAFSPAMTAAGKFATGIGKAVGAFTDLNEGAARVAKFLGVYDAAVDNTLGSHRSFRNALLKVSDAAKDAAQNSDDLVGAIKTIDSKTGETSVSIGGLAKTLINWKTLTVAGMAAAAFAVGDYIVKSNNKIMDHAAEVTRNTSEEIKAWDKVSEAVGKYAEYAQSSLDKAKGILSSYQEQETLTKTLMDTIGGLIEKENLSASEKERLKNAVEQLNGIYPELNLHIDDETGKLADSTGKVYENKQALDELSSSLLEAAQRQADFNALVETMSAMTNAQNGLDQTAGKYQDLRDKVKEAETELQGMNQAIQDGQRVDNERYQELRGQLSELGPAAKEAGESYITSMNQFSEAYENTLTLLARSDWDGFLAKLGELESAAQNTGLMIPENISSGIRDGSISASDAVSYMKEVMTLTQLTDESGLIGGAIPVEVATGIIGNAESVSEAVDVLQKLVEFSEAVTTAGEGGEGIAAELAAGIASGEISVEEAIASLNDLFELTKAHEKMSGDLDAIEAYLDEKMVAYKKKTSESTEEINATIKESSEKAKTDAQEGAEGVTKAWSDQVGPQKQAVDEIGQNTKKGIQDSGNEAVKTAQESAADVVKAFRDEAGNAETAGSELGDGAKTGLENKLQATEEMTKGKSTDIVNAIKSASGSSGAAGTTLASPAARSIAAVMETAASNVATWCSNMIANIANAVAYARNNPIVTRHTTINETVTVGRLTHSMKSAPANEQPTRAGFGGLNPMANMALATESYTRAAPDIHTPFLDSGNVINPVREHRTTGPDVQERPMEIDYGKLGTAVKEALSTLDFSINTQINGQTLVAETARLMDRELARRGGMR